MKKNKENKIIIYKTDKGPEMQVRLENETVWLTQKQIASLFSVNIPAISKHLKNIYKEGELKEKRTVSKMETVQKEGNRFIKRTQEFFNLDAVISVGYRINSKKATQFRIWATKTLREHIIQGFTINRKRVAENYDKFMQAVEGVRALLPAGMKADTGSILELIKTFADTWFSLDAYDKGKFTTGKATKKKIKVAASDLYAGIGELKKSLLKKGTATEIFAAEKTAGAVEGILGNVMQTFGGKELYPSLEEKAAHLLYFMVKNHPFVDGNKRSGAFAFVWFLKKAGKLNLSKISPEALTAITLLIAESQPKDKEKMTGLVKLILGN